MPPANTDHQRRRPPRTNSLARLRRGAFLGLDRLRGGAVASNVAEISAALADPAGELTRERQASALAALLTHVGATVPYYRELVPGGTHGSGSTTGVDPLRVLASLPVVDKRDYHARFDDFCSSAYDIDALPTVHTSASTGIPLRAPRDPGKRTRHVADLIAMGRLAGYDFGDPLLFLSVSRGLTGRNLQQRLQGIRYLNAQVLDDALVESVVAGVASPPRRGFLIGFPSALDHIGRSLLAAGRPLAPGQVAGVITISEGLTAWLATHGQDAFGAPVFARYSNEECGIIAQQTADSSRRYVVNRASYIVEVLALESDEPAPAGEMGRVVVTDLYSRAMPFIRYDTGDLGRACADHPGDLAEIVGRRGDVIYGGRGQAIAPTTLLYTMWAFDDVWQFQLIQTGRTTYRFLAVAQPDPARDAALAAALRDLIGGDVDLTIEYVDEIAAMPSGKRRPTANLWQRTGD